MPAQTATPAQGFDAETSNRLRTAIGRLSRQLRTTAAAREAGLSPTGISVLLGVVRGGPTTMSELAASEGINPTMLSRVVAGLVESDLLQRSIDPTDRRVAWVTDTRRGRRLAERMRRERTDAINAALAAIPTADRLQIEKALPALEALAEELKERRP